MQIHKLTKSKDKIYNYHNMKVSKFEKLPNQEIIKLAQNDAENLLNTIQDLKLLPISPTAIADKLYGAKAFTFKPKREYKSFSGFMEIVDGAYTINASETDAYVRQRFTFAHELGHIFCRENHLTKSEKKVNINALDFRDNLTSSGTDKTEIYCNNFAATLLMPSEKLKKLLNDGYSASQMSKIFFVSPEAMQHRLGY